MLNSDREPARPLEDQGFTQEGSAIEEKFSGTDFPSALSEEQRVEMQEMIERLRLIPIFSGLSSEKIERLAVMGEIVQFSSGQEIQTPDGLVLVIEDGEVNCFILDAADKKFLVGQSMEGDVLGELSFLCPEGGNDQKVELEAISSVTCFKMPAAKFFEVLDINDAEMRLLKMEAKRLSGMNAFARQAVDIEIDPAAQKARSFGEWLADAISAKIGSWQFIVSGAVFTGAWISANVVGLLGGADPYPFILLNLVFSIISAATMPVLLMSQNRQNQLDRAAARVNHLMTLRSNQCLESLLNGQAALLRRIDEMNLGDKELDSESSQDDS